MNELNHKDILSPRFLLSSLAHLHPVGWARIPKLERRSCWRKVHDWMGMGAWEAGERLDGLVGVWLCGRMGGRVDRQVGDWLAGWWASCLADWIGS